MSHINWGLPFFIDPTTGESVPPGTQDAFAFATYGNYGGGNGYSGGAFNSTPVTQPGGAPYTYAQLLAIGTDAQKPVDQLDFLFYLHDVGSQTPGYTQAQANADVALLKSLIVFNTSDPEASLYAGAAELGMIGSLGLHHHLSDISPAVLIAGLTDAAHDIQYGLGHLSPAELGLALGSIFHGTATTGLFVFDFAITTKSVGQEFIELVAMNVLNKALDFGEADDTPLHTGFPFPGTTHYELTYNVFTHDLDLITA